MKHLILIATLCGLAFSSCIKETEISTQQMEARSLKAWVTKNRPELLDTYQQDGGYYIDVKKWGNTDSLAVMEKDSCWVYYVFTGRDMSGNVVITRNEMQAYRQNKYTDFTHYVPYMLYAGESNDYHIIEGTYAAMRKEQLLGDEYVAGNTECRSNKFRVRAGSEFTLYLPSRVAYGDGGIAGDGGYQGENSLQSNVPIILNMKILSTVRNPAARELDMIDQLIRDDSAWTQLTSDDDASSGDELAGEGESGEGSKEKPLKGLYYRASYQPAERGKQTVPVYLQPQSKDAYTPVTANNPYKSLRNKAYTEAGEYDMHRLDVVLDSLMYKAKGAGIAANDMTDDNLVGKDNAVKVWYVARFVDGFVLDSNIPSVRELAFGETAAVGNAVDYTPKDDVTRYVSAWYYAIQKMHYGQWAMVLTSSGYAYGTTGISGSSTSSGSSNNYNDYYNYYNYYSGYYGDYGYNNYNNYYNNYYQGSPNTGTVTTSTKTEVLPYTPLIFYIYIEPKAK